jgi:uncharacterized protein (DUF2252 family)
MVIAKKSTSTALKSALHERPPIKQRIAQGKAIRKVVPRTIHAFYKPSKTRKDPINIILEQDKSRIQELVPIRHARMLTSPFAFLRGSAKIMIEDVALAPTSKIPVLANGDMHVANFGIYATAERNIVFSINDFDETHSGAWEWDIKRLTTSAVVCARFLGGDKVACEQAAREVVSTYRKKMDEYAYTPYLDLWYHTIKVDDVLKTLSPSAKKALQKMIAVAKKNTQLMMFEKMSHTVNNHRVMKSTGPLMTRDAQLESRKKTLKLLDGILQSYTESLTSDRRNLVNRYQILDIGRKVVGVGSVGTRCWVILLRGANDFDPLLLQIKEADTSVLAPFSDVSLPYENQGHRVVSGQRTVQGSPDIFLGWGDYKARDFYVRQLSDMKGGAEFIPGKTKLSNFVEYCGTCGWALALAHAKSGDAAMISGYCGDSDQLDTAFAKFAFLYADQTQKDYEAMQIAAKTGRIQVAKEF